MTKQYSKQARSGEGGMTLIAQRVHEMGFVWHPRRVDHGIDGEIEIVSGDRPTNRVLLVQSKARQRFPGEDAAGFHYICDPSDVEYWLGSNLPVVLVCSHPDTGEAWWASVSDAFRDAATRRSRRIEFVKARDVFDATAASALVDVALPPSSGVTVPCGRRREVLTSNLLPLDRLPATIWAAPSITGDYREAWKVLRRHELHAGDWILRDGTVFTFREPDESHLDPLIDGRAEALEVSEWADSKSTEICNDFTRLLRQTLVEMRHEEVRRHPKRHYLYFRSTPDLQERRLASGKSKTGRVVFRAYPDDQDPENATHFRHHAVDLQFVRFEQKWFVELNPTYHFTIDGSRDLPWGSDLVKGMKRLEKNSAVKSLVELWAHYLRSGRNGDLFESTYDELLGFGTLLDFEVDRGVDEAGWRRAATSSTTDTTQTTLFEAS